MLNIQYVKDLVWLDVQHTSFNCIVKYVEFNEEHPSTINGVDNYSHIKQIWNDGISGKYGVIKEYVAPIITAASAQPKQYGAEDL